MCHVYFFGLVYLEAMCGQETPIMQFYLLFYLYQSSFRLSSMERDFFYGSYPFAEASFYCVEVLEVVVPSKLVKRGKPCSFYTTQPSADGKSLKTDASRNISSY